MPSWPLAPGRFSTTTGWPSGPAIFCATSRAQMSEVEPAVKGTTNVIGFVGNGVWACAPGAHSAGTMAASSVTMNFFDMMSS